MSVATRTFNEHAYTHTAYSILIAATTSALKYCEHSFVHKQHSRRAEKKHVCNYSLPCLRACYALPLRVCVYYAHTFVRSVCVSERTVLALAGKSAASAHALYVKAEEDENENENENE